MTDQSVIIITGASSGIGAATAKLFALKGYRVVLVARRVELLKELQTKIELDGGEAYSIQGDVSTIDDIQRLVKTTMEQFGQIDVLFNNAGVGRLDWLENLDPKNDIQNQLSINLLGTIWTAQEVLPIMMKQKRGHIINMASMAGLIAPPMYSIYSASKFGVRGFSEALRREGRAHGIKVSVLYPGGVRNSFAAELLKKRRSSIRTPKWLALSDDQVAQAVWSLELHPRRMRLLPGFYRIVFWFTQIFPGLVDWFIEKFFVRRERRS